MCLSLNHRQDDGSDAAAGDAVKDDEEEGCDDRC